jgi:hypothetical protein
MLASAHARARHGGKAPESAWARDRRPPDHSPGTPRPRDWHGHSRPGHGQREHRRVRPRRVRRGTRSPHPRSRTVRRRPARRLLWSAQPPGHRRP